MSLLIEDKAPDVGQRASWKSGALAAAVTLLVIVIATAASYGAAYVFDIWSGIDQPRAFAAGEVQSLATTRVAVALFGFQIAALLSTLVADRLLVFPNSPLIRFAMPVGGVKTLALGVVALMALATVYTSVVYRFDKASLTHDLSPFVELLKAPTWWLLLIAAGVGAPLAEESLFRGLLFGGLRHTRLGFAGATLVTSVTWASLHANYSLYGLLAVSLIGVFLGYLRERTGSLLTSVVCHGCYNTLIVLLLVAMPQAGAPT